MENLNLMLVFSQGAMSFFSPCIYPLIPLYMSALTKDARHTDEEGNVVYHQKSVFLMTLCFVLGVSVVYILLAASASVVGNWIQCYSSLISVIAGVLIIVFALFELDIIQINALMMERKFAVNTMKMNPLKAFFLGFAFSFAWTPCIGPVMTEILLLAATSSMGYVYILVYALGLVIPFLLLGLFTSQILNYLKKHRHFVKWVKIIMAVIMIVIGCYMIKDGAKGFVQNDAPVTTSTVETESSEETSETAEKQYVQIESLDFTLVDQYGNTHTLTDYKGKVIFVTFFGTWCEACNYEMPILETLYQDYGCNTGDVIFLSLAAPNDGNEKDIDYIIEYMANANTTYPVLFDETYAAFYRYRISAFPTSFLFDKEGNCLGYINGALPEENLRELIENTLVSE